MTASELKYMTEAMAVDLAELLTKDFGMSIAEALDVLYNSETYDKLRNPDTGLYFQSANYVYAFLKEELAIRSLAN